MSDEDIRKEMSLARQFYAEEAEQLNLAKEELAAVQRRLKQLELAVTASRPGRSNVREAWLRDGSRDTSVGAVGERDEPLDYRVRDLSALAYLVATCNLLGVEGDGEWDAFMYARAIHRRVRALTVSESTAGASEDAVRD